MSSRTAGYAILAVFALVCAFAEGQPPQRGPKPTRIPNDSPGEPQQTYESKQPGDGLKLLWEDRGSVTTFGLLELRGHEYVFARGGGVSIIHAASCPCQRRRDPDGLPPGAFKVIDQKPPEKAEDE